MLHVQGQVGQADCHLITLPDGRHVLVDAGEAVDAKGAALSQLQRHGVTHIAVAILSHFHFDHYGQLMDLIDAGIKVDRVIINIPGDRRIADREMPWGCDYDHVMTTLAALDERGVAYQPARAGQRLIEYTAPDGTTTGIDVICAYDGVTTPVGETDINDTSIVMRLFHGTTRVLFTGDLNHTLGAYLAQSGADIEADILKAPHHGTEGCPPNEFYDRVHPSTVLVPSPTGLWLSQRSSRTRNYFADRETPTLVNGLHGNVTVWLSSGSYRVESEIRSYSADVTLTPGIVVQPATASVGAAANLTLSVTASGSPAPSVQWMKDGLPIPSATSATLKIPTAGSRDNGTYTVTVSNRHGTAISAPASVSVGTEPDTGPDSTLINLSARARTASGNDTLIAGFVVGGSGSKELLLRAIGPSLASHGVSDPLENPRLTLTTIDGKFIAHAINWSASTDKQTVAAATRQSGAFSLPADSRDAAIVVYLPPGTYTALANDRFGGTGVVLVELYDLNPASSARLLNLSARARVAPGEGALIGGFVTAGTQSARLLCRGIGTNLGRFGVVEPLLSPDFKLHDGARVVPVAPERPTAESAADPLVAAATVSTGAFDLTAGTQDAAAVITLLPGLRTAVLGTGDTSEGVALLELYLVP